MVLQFHMVLRNSSQTIIQKGLRRTITQASPTSNSFSAVVVGAGPAGIATVGILLDRNIKPILWVDRSFQGGRLNRYRNVPSNTIVSLFVAFARSVAPFRSIVESADLPNAYSTLKMLDQGKDCKIGYAADLCLQLTEGLEESMGVYKSLGVVTKVSHFESGDWLVNLSTDISSHGSVTTAIAPLLVLCTGSSPKQGFLSLQYSHLKRLDVDIALDPPSLTRSLSKSARITVALIGTSHSAILILHNLFNLASSSHPNLRIKWFRRHPLYFPKDMGGWTLHENIGLRGQTAVWAKDNLEDDRFEASGVSKFVERISTSQDETAAYKTHMPTCTHLIEAIGFSRDPLPVLERDRKELKVESDHTTGGFKDKNGEKVNGLYGVGIAWPERVIDPYGNVEYAVGMWKFMKYLKRIVRGWYST